MKYIVVRTYGNGKYVNMVFPIYCEYLSQAEKLASKLNEQSCESDDIWIPIPVYEYIGSVWE